MDIRSLRLYSDNISQESLVSVYNWRDRCMVIHPFSYSVIPDIENWFRKSDKYLLSVCSTSPDVEPPDFCDHLRSTLRRMRDNPDPLVTLFPGGKPRNYILKNGTWELVGPDLSGTGPRRKQKVWGPREFKMSFM